jgi:hypothetical protein
MCLLIRQSSIIKDCLFYVEIDVSLEGKNAFCSQEEEMK